MSDAARDIALEPPRRGVAGLLPKQLDLVREREKKIVIYRGGYRSGKTTGLVAKAIDLGRRHWPHPVLAVEPSFPMIRAVFAETARRLCEAWKLHCRWQESKKVLTIGRRFPVTIWCRSADSPRSLEGLTVGSLVGDEWELWPLVALKVAMARVSIGPLQQIVLGGTPEGFGPGYELLEKSPAPSTRIIVSRTADNFTVRASYAADMRARFSDEEAAEKLDGQRTVPSGRVYTRFDPDLHCGRPCLDVRRARLEVWADFNVALMAWAFVLVDDSNPDDKRFHVVGQLIGTHTDSQKQAARAAKWIAEWQRRTGRRIGHAGIKIVCDASGNERSAVTPLSHVINLREAGFAPLFGNENPRVDDRVASVQKVLGGPVDGAFAEPRMTFDEAAAEYIVRCIAQQPKGPDGQPSKDKELGLDHGADAIGYGVMWHDPAYRPRTAHEEAELRSRWERARARSGG